jgi:hypothetical protein
MHAYILRKLGKERGEAESEVKALLVPYESHIS